VGTRPAKAFGGKETRNPGNPLTKTSTSWRNWLLDPMKGCKTLREATTVGCEKGGKRRKPLKKEKIRGESKEKPQKEV